MNYSKRRKCTIDFGQGERWNWKVCERNANGKEKKNKSCEDTQDVCGRMESRHKLVGVSVVKLLRAN